MKTIHGAGRPRSSSSRTPIEAPDSLHSIAYAKILDLVSEGEIYGLVNGLRSIYLDETPLANADDSLNFKNVQVDTRNGTQDQEYITGFPAVENEITAGVELRDDVPWTRSFTNTNLSAIRIRLSVLQLSKTNTKNGDITGHSVQYAIDLATDGGDFTEVFKSAFTGKTTTKYERGHRIDLPPADTGWTVRVRRITANANSLTTADTTYVEAFTEIIDGKFRYPNSALVSIKVDAEQFQSVPKRAYHMKGMIVQVPSNYNAETRAYTGIWDGTFQPAYTNNPAWIYYDLITSFRYGLGHLISPNMVDKWRLYEIAQYCDELVDDGRSGMEPRFTCNLYMQRAADAYRVIQDLSTVFRGIIFWGAGTINAVADKPTDPVYVYNNANVLDGKFTYQGSPRKTRYTVALVSWTDMADFGRAKVEYVPDEEGILRYGIQETEVIAIGCSSQGQANRVGRWILATSNYETQSVSFAVGIDGTLAAPGQIVMIADANRAGRRIGGRVSSATTSAITVDSLPLVVAGNTITCVMADGTTQKRTVASVAGKTITVSFPFDDAPVSDSVWMVESNTLEGFRARVLGVSDNGNLTFNITAIQHNESKFDFVENGTPIEVPVTTELPASVQFPPSGIVVSHRFVADYSSVQTIVTADWEPVEGAVTYEVGYRMNQGGWSSTLTVNDSIIDLPNISEGLIEIRVNAVNAAGKRSVPVRAEPYQVPEAPPRSELPAVELEIVGGVVTVDCTFDYFRLQLTENVTSVLFVNVPTVKTIIIEVIQGGAFTMALPASVQPVSGVPYVPTQAVGALDILGLSTINTGALWKLLVKQPDAGEGGVLAVAIAPPTLSSSVATDGVTPTQPSVSPTVTVTGGTAPITGTWSRADGGGGTPFNVDDASSLTPVFSIASGTTSYPATTQTWRYTVTDSLGVTASATVTMTLERTAPAGDLLEFFDGESVFKTKLTFAPTVATAVVTLLFRRDGTWETSRSSPFQVVDTNNWISGPEFDSGDAYNIRFTPTYVSGDAGGISNGAAAMSSLSSNRSISLTKTQAFPGATSAAYSVLVEIEEAANPGVIVASGTVSLEANAEYA